MTQLFVDGARTTLDSDLDTSAESFYVTDATGFPKLLGDNDFFICVITRNKDGTQELVRVHDVNDRQFLCLRAIAPTNNSTDFTRENFEQGDRVELTCNAEWYTDIQNMTNLQETRQQDALKRLGLAETDLASVKSATNDMSISVGKMETENITIKQGIADNKTAAGENKMLIDAVKLTVDQINLTDIFDRLTTLDTNMQSLQTDVTQNINDIADIVSGATPVPPGGAAPPGGVAPPAAGFLGRDWTEEAVNINMTTAMPVIATKSLGACKTGDVCMIHVLVNMLRGVGSGTAGLTIRPVPRSGQILFTGGAREFEEEFMVEELQTVDVGIHSMAFIGADGTYSIDLLGFSDEGDTIAKNVRWGITWMNKQ